MTRVRVVAAGNIVELERLINGAIAEVEAQAYGVKSVQYLHDMARGLYSAMVVYGNGPTTARPTGRGI